MTEEPLCAYCGKSEQECFLPIQARADEFVCDECVDLLADIVRINREKAAEVGASDARLGLLSCRVLEVDENTPDKVLDEFLFGEEIIETPPER